MRRVAGLAVAAFVGMASANAADLPGHQAAADDGLPLVPLFAWAGAYVGVSAGYGVSTFTYRPACTPPAGCPAIGPISTSRDGFVGGGQVGYQLQVGRFVGGLETDAQYADLGRAVAGPGFAATQRLDYLGTVRARFGVAADRFLLYVTGGLAYGDVTARQTVQTFAPPAILAGGRSGLEAGYAAGGGLEYGVAEHVTARVEAYYFDLGSLRFGTSGPAPSFAGARFTTEGVVARAGLNYKFSLF